MNKQIFLLFSAVVIFASCHKTDDKHLTGRWKLAHETKFKLDGSKDTEQTYPYEGNTSVLVFEQEEIYRYTEVKSLKITADTGIYNLQEKRLYSEKTKTTGEIIYFKNDTLTLNIFNPNRKTHQRIFERMKE